MRIHNYSLRSLKPKLVDDLIRLGNKDRDGGYILSNRQIGITKVLIGLGIHYDWTFEEHFKKRNKDSVLYCYDFSVGKWAYIKGFILSSLVIISPFTYANALLNRRKENFFLQPFIEISAFFRFFSFFKTKKKNFFYQKGISDHKYGKFITIDEMMSNLPNLKDLGENSIYLKMDIEGSEYDVIEDILKYKNKINGIVIEFHNLKQLWNEFIYLVTELNNDYEIIHLHGNNCGGTIADTQVPNLVEVSFMKRTLLTSSELTAINNKTYPLPDIDKPNLTNKADIPITF